MPTTTPQLRLEFFDWLFSETEGYACIATAEREEPRRTFKQHFFHWPTQKEEMSEKIDFYAGNRHLWFCVNLFESAERVKEKALPLNLVWADLDTCHPSEVEPYPTLVIQSSPDRFQAIWKVNEDIAPEIAEDYSKRIAYKYVKDGADPTGWDLTQLLRVPFTVNFKYLAEPLVILLPDISPNPVALQTFEGIERAPDTGTDRYESIDAPIAEELADVEQVIYKYAQYLDKSFYELFQIEPDTSHDWSARMWKLLNLSFEAGMEREEVFAIALQAKCNKYLRDRRPVRYLWREVLKAEEIQQRITVMTGTWEPLLMPDIVDRAELTNDTFIHRYAKWASEATDAVPIFHELAGAILLSATLAGEIRLDVSYGSLVPNLWGMILGESTLTRKTTAMTMATNILYEVDPEAMLASDGSAEGLMTALSHRPGRVSLFYKDEVSGFFDSINRKDYLAGMPETLTQLYDVPKVYQRILRKETVTINSPVFLFFGGGIRDKVYSLITEEYILSGFLPRFLVVSGDTDLSSLRRTGPPIDRGLAARQRIVNELLDMREQYQVTGYMKVAGQLVPLSSVSDKPLTKAILSPDAWERYGQIEQIMLETAHGSYYQSLALPVFERLSRSLLKLAMLLAASRQPPEARLFPVTLQDIINAAGFIQSWGKHSIELLLNAGKTQHFKLLEKIRAMIDNRPGIYKSEIMRANRLSSRDINDLIGTLMDRGEIQRKSKGRAEQYWIVH